MLAYFVHIGGITLKYCYITSLSFKFTSYLPFFSGIAKLMRCLCFHEYDILKVNKTAEVFVQFAFKLSAACMLLKKQYGFQSEVLIFC